MRKFILKTLLFVFILAVPAVIAEFYIRSLPNAYIYKIDYLKSHAENIETLILGHSHTMGGINPNLLGENCFNMAMGSQGYIMDEFVLEKYINNLPNLSCVILPLSFSNVTGAGPAGDAYLTYYKIYYNYQRNPLSKKDYEIFLKSKYKKMENGIKGISLIWCDSLGYVSSNEKYRDDAIREAKSQNKGRPNSSSLLSLDNIVNICKNKSVQVILVTTPTIKTYQSNLDSSQFNAMYEMVKTITNKYDNVHYINYSDYYLCSDSSYFTNSTHLNEKGAEIFTLKLKQDIKELIK